MVRLKRSFSVDATDLGPLVGHVIAEIPEILQRLRQLEFVDGAAIHPDTGVRLEGLTDPMGTHPRPGTRYAIMLARQSLHVPEEVGVPGDDGLSHEELMRAFDDDWNRRHAEALEAAVYVTSLLESELELVDDDAQSFGGRLLVGGKAPFGVSFTITQPGDPAELLIDAVVPVAVHRFVDGDVVVNGRVKLGAIPGGRLERAQVRFSGAHRRARFDVSMKITQTAPNRWSIDVESGGRGRGLVRPLLAVVGFWGRRRLRDWIETDLEKSIAEFESAVAEEAAEMPESIAAGVVSDLLDAVVENLDEVQELADRPPPATPACILRSRLPRGCPRWLWAAGVETVEVDGRPCYPVWGGDVSIDIDRAGAVLRFAGSRRPLEVTVQPGDVVQYQETWMTWRQPTVEVENSPSGP